MTFDREAAKRAGYSDQEIESYLAKETPPPPSVTPTTEGAEPPPPTTVVPEVDRTNSMAGTAGGAAVAAAPWALGAAGLYGLKSMIPHAVNAIKGAGAVAPEAKTATKVASMASNNAIRDIAMQGLSKGVQGVTAAAGAIAPYVRGLGGAALALHSEGLNNGEDEMVRRMHQQQDQQVANGRIAPAQPQGPAVPPGY